MKVVLELTKKNTNFLNCLQIHSWICDLTVNTILIQFLLTNDNFFFKFSKNYFPSNLFAFYLIYVNLPINFTCVKISFEFNSMILKCPLPCVF